MDFPTKEVIAGLVTLSVAAIGFVQWRRGKRSGRYLEDRESAYKEVWLALEEAHLLARAARFDSQAFDLAAKSANTSIIRHGLYIAEPDREAAAHYLAAMRELGAGLAKHSDSRGAQEIALTGEHPAVQGDLLKIFQQHLDARQRVMDLFRQAIGAGQI